METFDPTSEAVALLPCRCATGMTDPSVACLRHDDDGDLVASVSAALAQAHARGMEEAFADAADELARVFDWPCGECGVEDMVPALVGAFRDRAKRAREGGQS